MSDVTTISAPAQGNEEGLIREYITNHESGIQFAMPKSTKPNFGLDCWGQRLNRPQFKEFSELDRAIEGLDTAVEREVLFGGPTAISPFGRATDYKAIVSANNGDLFTIASKDYKIVQDREVFGPVRQAMFETGLKPVGRIDTGGGSTHGHVVIANPERTIKLLTDHPDHIMLGLRVWNSYDKTSGFGVEAFGIRMVCCNYNLWGNILGVMRGRHMKSAPELVAKLKSYIDSMILRVPVLVEYIQKSQKIAVQTQDVEALLWGIGLPLTTVEQIAKDVEGLNPDIRTAGLNGWTLYNATTAFLSYKPKSGEQLDTTINASRNATLLLTEGHDSLILKGQEAKKAFEAKREAREARVEAPLVQVVGQ